jgi:signal transduction histidine kinase
MVHSPLARRVAAPVGSGWRALLGVGARRAFLDVALALVGAYVAVILTAEISVGVPRTTALVAGLLAAGYGGVIVVRRHAPAGVLAAQAVAATGYLLVGLPVFMLGPAVLVTLYTLGAQLPRARGLALLAGAVAVMALLLWAGPSFPGVGSVVLFGAVLAAAWFLGDVVQRWRLLAYAHARRAVELEQARGEVARLAVAGERLRIARELHDVVAHSMSVISMHAGSGRLAAERDPVAARRALEVVERSSREALTELRRLVTVLRDTDDNPAMAPASRLTDVHGLVAEVAAAGVTVDVHTAGDLASVPEGVSLAAYRIVQEALTNVVRHAMPARADLQITVREDVVLLEILDDGAPTSGASPPGRRGHGMIGMRERAALYGGELDAGPRLPGGGWRVAARLPFAAGVQ